MPQHTRTLSATAMNVQHAHSAMSQFLHSTAREQEAFYVQNPMRFGKADAGEAVPFGSSSRADNPAPGGGKQTQTKTQMPQPIGPPGQSSAKSSKPASNDASPASFSDAQLPTPADDPFDPFPGVDALDLRLLRLIAPTRPAAGVAKAFANGAEDADWSEFEFGCDSRSVSQLTPHQPVPAE
jgi:hypothetical protein